MTLSTLSVRDAARLVLVLALGITAYYIAIQPTLTEAGGRGWDGLQYAQMAEGDISGIKEVVLPGRLRLFGPMIVRALPFPHDLLGRFFVLGFLCAAVYAWASFEALRSLLPEAPSVTQLFAWLLLNLAESGPLRLARFAPINTDGAHLAITTLFVCLLLRQRDRLRAWTTPVYAATTFLIFFCGTLNRENFATSLLFFVLVLPRVRATLPAILSAGAGIAFAAGVMRWLSGVWLIHDTAGALYVENLMTRPIGQVLSALVNSLGTFLLILSLQAHLPQRPGDDRTLRASLWLIVLANFGLAVGGGSNVDRYLHWSTLFLALLCMPVLVDLWQGRYYKTLGSLLVLHVVFQRAIFRIHPSAVGVNGMGAPYSLRQIFVGDGPYMSHWSQMATPEMIVGLLAAFAIACLVLHAALALHNSFTIRA